MPSIPAVEYNAVADVNKTTLLTEDLQIEINDLKESYKSVDYEQLEDEIKNLDRLNIESGFDKFFRDDPGQPMNLMNLKSDFAQSRLTSGDLVSGFSINNEDGKMSLIIIKVI